MNHLFLHLLVSILFLSALLSLAFFIDSNKENKTNDVILCNIQTNKKGSGIRTGLKMSVKEANVQRNSVKEL